MVWLRAIAGCCVFVSLVACASQELKDDPKLIQDDDGVAYFVVESDTRIRKLLFRSKKAEHSAAVFNLSPGVQVAAFQAGAASYCLFEVATNGISFTNPDQRGCFDVDAGASKYVGHLMLKNSKVGFRWEPLEGNEAFADAYPKLYAAYPRH